MVGERSRIQFYRRFSKGREERIITTSMVCESTPEDEVFYTYGVYTESNRSDEGYFQTHGRHLILKINNKKGRLPEQEYPEY